MKKIIVILVGVLMIGLSMQSCKKDDPFNNKEYWEVVGETTDSRLIGDYVYHSYWADSDGIEERSYYESFKFNSTNKCTNYYNRWSYTFSSGWTNALKEGHFFEDILKIENNEFKTHLFDNEYADWYSDGFEYIDNNNIKIGGLLFTKDNNRTTINNDPILIINKVEIQLIKDRIKRFSNLN